MEITSLAHVDDSAKIVKQNLYIQRNSLPYISCLPTEILATIFILGARAYHEFGMGAFCSPPRAPSWVNVSYVCHHWRNVALNCPTLWSYIFTTSLCWTDELLVRSKQAPLKICVTPRHAHSERWWRVFAEKVNNHKERIQDLWLHISDTGISLVKLFPSAPFLHTLRVMNHGIDQDVSPLFHCFLDGNSPALHTLQLLGCPLPRNSLKLSGLTTFHLQDVPTRFRYTVEEFLVVIRDMQDLTHLYLQDALANHDSSDAPYKITLPRLSYLLVADSLSTVVALLSCIDVPSTAKVRLRYHIRDGPSRAAFTSLSSCLGQGSIMAASQAPFSPIVRSMAIQDNRSELAFAFSTSEHGPSVDDVFHSNHGCDIPLKISFGRSAPSHRLTMQSIAGAIYSTMPLMNVQRIDVFDLSKSEAFWKHALAYLPNLRSIKLTYGYTSDLASALSFAPHEGGEIFAPALEELELLDVAFSANSMVEPPPDLQALYDALSTRKEHRGRLTMTQCWTQFVAGWKEQEFDMLGWWMDGHFHVICKHDYPRTQV